jgi:hypothetical protein
LASTTYCLADPGNEYLVYLPRGGSASIDLSKGKAEFRVEWFDPKDGKTIDGGTLRGGSRRQMSAPFGGDAVVYLVRRS